MARKIYGLMSENKEVTYFFDVGVYHLLGKDNLLRALVDVAYEDLHNYMMGYQNTRIPPRVKFEDFHRRGKGVRYFFSFEVRFCNIAVPDMTGLHDDDDDEGGKGSWIDLEKSVKSVEIVRPDVSDLIALLFTGKREWEVGDVKRVTVRSETFDPRLFENVFEMFDPENKNVTGSLLANVANHRERLKLLQAPDALLVKLLIQVKARPWC